MELLERAKVIEELKYSLTTIMDKYTKLKIELDKQKQYGLQLSASLHQAQKKKSRIMSSFRTIANSTSSSFSPASLHRVTHFSHYFPRSTCKKKIKLQIEDNNENIKKLKEELENCKKESEKKENSYISQINIINKELEKMTKKNEEFEQNFQNFKKNKKIEMEKEIENRKKIMNEEIEKYKKEIDIINLELKKVKEENNLIKNENKNVKEMKNELECNKKKERENDIIINELKMENERLKKQSALNYKLIKEENDDLIKDINKLNDVIKLMKNKEKEYKEKEEKEKKEKEEIEKKKMEEERKRKAEEKEREKDRYENAKNKFLKVLKVMRVYSNSFICKNSNSQNSSNNNNYNNNLEIVKLKEIEKKYIELKQEKDKNNENNMRNEIVHLKEIKSIKEKYEKEIKELKEDNTSLNKQINVINIKNTSYHNSNIAIKKVISDISEHFNKIMQNTQKKYENKIYNMKQKIKKIKNILIKYMNKNNNKEKEEDKNIVVINGLKEEISKIEKGKQKLEVQLSNYDIHFKKQKNEITKLKNELLETNKKLDKLKNENRWNENDKSDLDDMNKKLKKQLEMYIIENFFRK